MDSLQVINYETFISFISDPDKIKESIIWVNNGKGEITPITGKDLRLSTYTKYNSKKQTLVLVGKLLRQVLTNIKVTRGMTEVNIAIATKVFYKNYFWMSVPQLFEFFEWLISGGPSKPFYESFDSNKLMNLAAEWEAYTLNWGNEGISRDEGIKQIDSGDKAVKRNYYELAKKLDAKRMKRQVAIQLSGLKRYRSLEAYCEANNIEYDQQKGQLFHEYNNEFYSLSQPIKDKMRMQDHETDDLLKARYINSKIQEWLKVQYETRLQQINSSIK